MSGFEGWVSRQADKPLGWLVGGGAVLAVPITRCWWPTPDAAAYLSIARSVWKGQGLTRFGSPQLYYSPGYPLIISPAFLFSDRPFLLLSCLHWVFAVAAMVGVYFWVKPITRHAAALVALLCVLNAAFWQVMHPTLSEAVFTPLLIWTALLLNRAAGSRSLGRAVGWALVGALLLIATSLTRYAGVFLAAGFAVAVMIKARSGECGWARAMGLTLLVGLPASAALIGLIRHESGAAGAVSPDAVGYTGQVFSGDHGLVGQVIEGVRLRVSDVGRAIVPGMLKAYARQGQWFKSSMVVYIPLAAALVWSWTRLVRRRVDVLAWTLPGYLGLYIVWPYDQGPRFIVPMLALFWVCVWLLIEKLGRHRLSILAILLAAHSAIAIGYWLRYRGEVSRNHAMWPAIEKIAMTVRPDPPQAVMVGALDRDVHMMLQLELDRTVADCDGRVRPEPPVQWVVTQDQSLEVPGFSIHSSVDGLRLLGRE